MAVNQNLVDITPELPEGYRFRLSRASNRYATEGHIDTMYLEKKGWFFWSTVGSDMLNKFTGPAEVAKKLYAANFSKGGYANTEYLGTTR